MKTRMFQHFVFLTLSCILMCGCQSGPLAGSAQSNDLLSQNTTEPQAETPIQKKLREAMAIERQKGRSSRNQRNIQNESTSSLVELTAPELTENDIATNKNNQAVPVSSTQPAPGEFDDATVLHELNLAYDADRAGNLEKARGYYQRVLTIDPDNFGALHRLAILEDKKQNFPAAEAYYLRALKSDPDNSDLLSDIGYSYMLQGRDDYGEKYLLEALKYQPRHSRSLDHLGWFYGRAGQYDQAMALFRMTSGEAQAQLKFAQLFPGVEPDIVLAQGISTQHNVQMVASENTNAEMQTGGQHQPGMNQQVQYANVRNNPAAVNQMQAQPGTNPTLQIAEMMKREREKAMQARRNQQLPSINSNQSLARQATAPLNSTTPHVQNLGQASPEFSGSDVSTPRQASQIQAWPPANDPGIAQAVEASKYWASQEQQQTQNQRARQLNQLQTQQQQYRNHGLQRTHQRPFQAVPAGRPQMRTQQMVPTNVPRAGQPQFGNQYQNPGQFPGYRINSTNTSDQTPKPMNPQAGNNQEQIRQAALTGMNMGPGQMFPVADKRQAGLNDSSLMNTPTPVSNILPASAQVPDQNAYQAGGQSIRQLQQPAYQNQRTPNFNQAGFEFPNQNSRQRNGSNPALQHGNAVGFQHVTSAVPPSALYSNNPAVAPANVRSSYQTDSGNNSSPASQESSNFRQNSFNQNANNQQMPFPVQRGTQQQASPYQFPVQQSRY